LANFFQFSTRHPVSLDMTVIDQPLRS